MNDVDGSNGVFARRWRCSALVTALAVAMACGSASAQDDLPSQGESGLPEPAVDLHLDQYQSRAWGLADGLPSSEVFDLLQTQDGYLWIATGGGLARFDGVKFTVFDPENTPALSSKKILRLYESRDGTLWAGTEGGGLTAFRRGRHRPAVTIDELSGLTVRALIEDSDGDLWAGTDSGTWRSQHEGVFERVEDAPEVVVAMAEDSDGTLWFGGPAGLAGWKKGGAITPSVELFSREEGVPEVTVLVADPDGSLWIGTDGHGIVHAGEQLLGHYLPNATIVVLHRRRNGDILYTGKVGKLKRFVMNNRTISNGRGFALASTA